MHTEMILTNPWFNELHLQCLSYTLLWHSTCLLEKQKFQLRVFIRARFNSTVYANRGSLNLD